MVHSSTPFRPLSHRLIWRVIWVAVACGILFSTLKATLAYRQAHSTYQQAVEQVAQMSLPSLSLALWDVESQTVQQHVDWLASLPDLGWVQVRADIGEVFTAGRIERSDPATTLRFDIVAPNGSSTVGSIEIRGDRNRFLTAVTNAVLQVLLEYAVFTLLICLVIAWILRNDLQAPLQQIADFANRLRPGQLTQPLRLMPRDPRVHDEIDLVVQGIAHLQDELRTHIETLDRTVEDRTRELNELVSRIHRQAITDPVTLCYNRHVLEERLPSEVERCTRRCLPLSVLFIDLDHFKAINDRWGHAVGDHVLRAVCQRLNSHIHSGVDWIARYGGEEFVVILPESDLEKALKAAERLRAVVASEKVETDGLSIPVTVSVGVASWHEGDTIRSLLARADEQVYAAKRQGRNRVNHGEGPSSSIPQAEAGSTPRIAEASLTPRVAESSAQAGAPPSEA